MKTVDVLKPKSNKREALKLNNNINVFYECPKEFMKFRGLMNIDNFRSSVTILNFL